MANGKKYEDGGRGQGVEGRKTLTSSHHKPPQKREGGGRGW
jgi:hypothetical protein